MRGDMHSPGFPANMTAMMSHDIENFAVEFIGFVLIVFILCVYKYICVLYFLFAYTCKHVLIFQNARNMFKSLLFREGWYIYYLIRFASVSLF